MKKIFRLFFGFQLLLKMIFFSRNAKSEFLNYFAIPRILIPAFQQRLFHFLLFLKKLAQTHILSLNYDEDQP